MPRLLEALDYPETVVLVHWDNFETELRNPPPVAPADRQRVEAMIGAIRRTAPRTRTVVPRYLTGYTFA